MQIDSSQLLWALINIFLFIFIVYVLYNAYRNVKNRAENQRIQNETIINQLEEVTELNKKIIDILSDKKS